MIKPTSAQTDNKGIIRAYSAGDIAKAPVTLASIGIVRAMNKIGTLPKEDTITIKRAASKALTETGLRAKGTKMIFVPTINLKDTNNIIDYSLDCLLGFRNKTDKKAQRLINKQINVTLEDSKILSKGFNFIKKHMSPKDIEAYNQFKALPLLSKYKLGLNASYLDKANTIIIPDKNLAISAFHEMGHALNANFSKVGKALQKMRIPSMILASTIGLVGVCTKRKEDDSMPNKGIDRLQHFVKKNSGILTFMSMLPVIIEEGLASFKGNKIASNLLTKNLANKVKLTNALGLSTYVLTAVGMAIATNVAVNVKDSIQDKHEIKVAKKYAKEQAQFLKEQAKANKKQAKANKKQDKIEQKEAKKQAKLEAKQLKLKA